MQKETESEETTGFVVIHFIIGGVAFQYLSPPPWQRLCCCQLVTGLGAQ